MPSESASEGALSCGYVRGVFVKATRGSSIDVGLFHDEQKRSVATVEAWVNAANAGGEGRNKVGWVGVGLGGARRFKFRSIALKTPWGKGSCFESNGSNLDISDRG